MSATQVGSRCSKVSGSKHGAAAGRWQVCVARWPPLQPRWPSSHRNPATHVLHTAVLLCGGPQVIVAAEDQRGGSRAVRDAHVERGCLFLVSLNPISRPGSGIGKGNGPIGWAAPRSRAVLPQVANQEAAPRGGLAGTARAPAVPAAAPVITAIATASPVVVISTSIPPIVVSVRHGCDLQPRCTSQRAQFAGRRLSMRSAAAKRALPELIDVTEAELERLKPWCVAGAITAPALPLARPPLPPQPPPGPQAAH